MVGGFMGVGSPHRVISALVARGARDLTVIANDTARSGLGVGKLISAGCVARVIASHIGTNPETQRLMLSGEIEVELVPQGTLAERIRAGGAGLGGVLTATGLGTVNHTQKGKPKIVDELTLPATSLRPVTLIVTDMAVIEPTEKGLVLRETAPGITVETVCEATGTRLIVPPNVTVMSVGTQVETAVDPAGAVGAGGEEIERAVHRGNR